MTSKPTNARTGERKPRVDGVEARARILDCAEELFALRGFYGTSVRDITERAEVRLASVNYHFVSKETLFRDVVQRRAETLAHDRYSLLERVASSGSKRKRTRDVVRAFVLPVATRAQESVGWRSYLTLIAQVSSSRLEALALVADCFNPMAQRFIDALGDIFEGCPPRTLHQSYRFMLGATLYAFSGSQRLESLTRGKLRSDNYAETGLDLIAYLTPAVLGSCSGES